MISMLVPVLVSARPANPVDGGTAFASPGPLTSSLSHPSFAWTNAGWAGIKQSITGTDADAASDPAAPIVPAAPFRIAGVDATDLARARGCLTAALYYEAASEGDAGERAVAQVVLNRVRHPAFPNSVCGVVYEGATKATGCQFTFTCDGSLSRKPSRWGWARAARIADAALGGFVDPAVGMATHYHTTAVNPYWSASLTTVATIGAHVFYRWQGYWGTSRAFTSAYSGVEPLPITSGGAQAVADTAEPQDVIVADAAPVARPAFTPLGLNENAATKTPVASTAITFSPLGMARRDGGLKLPHNSASTGA